jgi:hypothetical protein
MRSHHFGAGVGNVGTRMNDELCLLRADIVDLKHKNISQRDGKPFAPILADVQTKKEAEISEDDASAGASNTSAGDGNDDVTSVLATRFYD